MWILLAAALLALRFYLPLALILLAGAAVWGGINGVVQPVGALALLLVVLSGAACMKWRDRRAISIPLEGVLVAAAAALMLHLIPGFHNPRVLDSIHAGPRSVGFSMYFNFDKALVPFLLLCCLPTLFVASPLKRAAFWQWLLLVLAVPLLLLAAVALGGLGLELHRGEWLLPFAFANLFFVSLAEEALFRGWLLQRLCGVMSAPLALLLSAVIFGLMHIAGGVLLVVFATLAGVLYGLAWLWSGRLWVATVLHFALNLCHALFFTYPMLQHGR
ncbi:CPBP family intramembrane metalloprotease [Erwinia sp. CPCC 100877]|nr:CPBP family intramembrane metalloprotease [Erwinia sp. CPCC 100877]